MDFVQARLKAVAAFLSVWVSNLYAFYQVHQNLTLKQVVASLVAALIGGTIVHQVSNKE
jgi:hypothetical protein